MSSKDSKKNNSKKKQKYLILILLSIIIIGIIIGGMVVKKVTVVVDGEEKICYTFAKTYGDMISKLKIEVEPEDYISIDINDIIDNNSIVYIKNAQAVIIKVDNKEIYHKTIKDTVGEVLNELNISFDENDKLSKAVSETINDNDSIVITRVDIKEESSEEEIEFQEKIVKDYKTYAGESRIIEEGQVGKKKLLYNVTYEDGIEVKRELVGEEIISEPSYKVIGEGIFDPNYLGVCVNRRRGLDANFEPDDLVVPNVRSVVSSNRVMLRSEAAEALENLFAGADDEGIYLYAVSGYRSYNYQASIYNPYSGYSAPPGASEHQLGLAMDVSSAYYGSTLTTEFGYTAEGQWLANNAHNYGFIVRYLPGKEDITGYYYEPWHIRYVGVELATELFNSGKTLEEYYGEY